jgi:hypothetical protein
MDGSYFWWHFFNYDAEKIAEHLAKLFPEKLFKHLKKH